MTTPVDSKQMAVGTYVKPDGTTTKTDNSTLDKDSFLKLLVAQLKYQSPDNPADSSQMMQQSAQFSMLEALQNLQKDQSAMLVNQNSSTANGLLGRKITAVSATGGNDITGVVTSVKLGTDGPVLKLGDMEVPLNTVKEVTSP